MFVIAFFLMPFVLAIVVGLDPELAYIAATVLAIVAGLPCQIASVRLQHALKTERVLLSGAKQIISNSKQNRETARWHAAYREYLKDGVK